MENLGIMVFISTILVMLLPARLKERMLLIGVGAGSYAAVGLIYLLGGIFIIASISFVFRLIF